MAGPDDNVPGRDSAPGAESVPEPIPDRPEQATGEVSMLPPEEASKVAAEIRAVAESRGDDSEVVDLTELEKQSPRARRSTLLPPMPSLAEVPSPPSEPEDLLVDELRDAWPLLDLDERGDGLRVL